MSLFMLQSSSLHTVFFEFEFLNYRNETIVFLFEHQLWE